VLAAKNNVNAYSDSKFRRDALLGKDDLLRRDFCAIALSWLLFVQFFFSSLAFSRVHVSYLPTYHLPPLQRWNGVRARW